MTTGSFWCSGSAVWHSQTPLGHIWGIRLIDLVVRAWKKLQHFDESVSGLKCQLKKYCQQQVRGLVSTQEVVLLLNSATNYYQNAACSLLIANSPNIFIVSQTTYQNVYKAVEFYFLLPGYPQCVWRWDWVLLWLLDQSSYWELADYWVPYWKCTGRSLQHIAHDHSAQMCSSMDAWLC